MHLSLDAPNIWFLVGLHAPGLDVVGMSLPGAPGVVAGHSKAVAWGFTNAMVDDSDLSGLVGELGIDAIISPRLLSVSLALHFARKGKVKSVAALLEDSVEVFEVEAVAGSRLVGTRLSELGLPRGMLLVAVQRGDTILIPAGEDAVEAGDRVIVAATTDNASRLDDFLVPRA
jgi:trk system potassium uptake protein TrkA